MTVYAVLDLAGVFEFYPALCVCVCVFSARELELEDRQSRLQQELRERMAVDGEPLNL